MISENNELIIPENIRYLRIDNFEKNSKNPLLDLPTNEIRLIENAKYVKLESRRRNAETVSPNTILKYWTDLYLRIEEQNIPNGYWHSFINEII